MTTDIRELVAAANRDARRAYAERQIELAAERADEAPPLDRDALARARRLMRAVGEQSRRDPDHEACRADYEFDRRRDRKLEKGQ